MLADLLLIMADDLSPELLAAAHTPNLDALAAVSTTFTQHHGGAACSASRASLLTGKYCFQHKVGSIFNQNHDTGWSLEITNPLTLLPALVPGSSILIGKHHLNSDTFPDHAFTVCGYDSFIGTTGNLGKPNGYRDFEFYDNYVKYHSDGIYATNFFCREATIAIQGGYNFVHLALHAAHDPLHWPPATTYNTLEQRTAIVESMDFYLGPVIEAAQTCGMRIVFTSDNGGDKDVGGKGNLMSAALRVPLMIHNPDQIGSYVVSDITDWTSLRYWIQTGTVVFPSVINIDKFKGVQYVDWSTYEEAVITQDYKLIINSGNGVTLYKMPEEEEIYDERLINRLYSRRLNK